MKSSMQNTKGRPPRKDNPQRFTLRLSAAAKKKANRIAGRNGVPVGKVIEHMIMSVSDDIAFGVVNSPESAK